MGAFEERRLRVYWFDNDDLLELLKCRWSANRVSSVSISNIPDDAVVVACETDFASRSIHILVASSEFPVVPPGAKAPVADKLDFECVYWTRGNRGSTVAYVRPALPCDKEQGSGETSVEADS